jgi:hypothetical protein
MKNEIKPVRKSSNEPVHSAYPSDKPYGHTLLENSTQNPKLCICGEPLDNNSEHYIHMTSGY